MTWGELVAAVEAYGVKAEDRIFGIRLDGMTQDVGIKRTPLGVQIVSQGRIRSGGTLQGIYRVTNPQTGELRPVEPRTTTGATGPQSAHGRGKRV